MENGIETKENTTLKPWSNKVNVITKYIHKIGKENNNICDKCNVIDYQITLNISYTLVRK